jgi:2-polyprenyl-3-methyl-5-hydroxy-6-metoxy-1,4-benzoquinol methylase
MPRQQLRDLVDRVVREHYAHIREVSSEGLARRYFDSSLEQAAIAKVLYRVQMLAPYLPTKKPALRVLDVGVGTGSLPVVLSALDFEVYGLDDDGGGHRLVETLAARFPSLKIHVCALEADDYPYDDNTFDVVTSFDVIEHLPGSPRHYLAEISRILKPGGLFFLSNPNVVSLANRVLTLMGRSIYHPLSEWFNPPGDDDTGEFSGHWREYSVAEMIYMMTAIRFRVIERGCRSRLLIGRDGRWNVLYRIAYRVSDIITSTIFPGMRDEVYVICQKPSAQ